MSASVVTPVAGFDARCPVDRDPTGRDQLRGVVARAGQPAPYQLGVEPQPAWRHHGSVPAGRRRSSGLRRVLVATSAAWLTVLELLPARRAPAQGRQPLDDRHVLVTGASLEPARAASACVHPRVRSAPRDRPVSGLVAACRPSSGGLGRRAVVHGASATRGRRPPRDADRSRRRGVEMRPRGGGRPPATSPRAPVPVDHAARRRRPARSNHRGTASRRRPPAPACGSTSSPPGRGEVRRTLLGRCRRPARPARSPRSAPAGCRQPTLCAPSMSVSSRSPTNSGRSPPTRLERLVEQRRLRLAGHHRLPSCVARRPAGPACRCPARCRRAVGMVRSVLLATHGRPERTRIAAGHHPAPRQVRAVALDHRHRVVVGAGHRFQAALPQGLLEPGAPDQVDLLPSGRSSARTRAAACAEVTTSSSAAVDPELAQVLADIARAAGPRCW